MEDATSLKTPSIALSSIQFSTKKCWSHLSRGTRNKRAMLALYRSTVFVTRAVCKTCMPPYGLSVVVAAIV
ncbi:hypothetical protein DPMN_179974 [Dreissena polymorpha]|uniref:Uncharacterized protein n=1 Tax=Dreissena polymorpha TaxID=45954 RepID=A0A9D4IL93_DREPO|nr:hypothetical protein DPMN_179969 [Dreissena polymorpha]KAH3778507.1 hypothetical protein DPMN_179971 [Dreissena polymorpha]KAH3778510.1 hypothetical protein DPMN_179974 [Dreissena polymorpha]